MFTFLSPTSAPVRPAKLGPDCTTCGLITKCRYPKQIPTKATAKKVIVIDAPEDRAGSLEYDDRLAQALLRHNVALQDYTIVPVSACPGDNSESWRHCQPLLISNLKKLNPETVIVIGKNATNSMIDYLWQHPAELLDRWYGRRIPSRTLNAWVYPIGRAGMAKNPVVSQMQHFRWLRTAVRSEGRPYEMVPDYNSMVQRLWDKDAIIAALKRAAGSKLSAFDYEANHLKCTKPGAKLYSASVAWLENGTPECIAFMCDPVLADAWRDYLISDSYKIAANLKFEHRWSRRFYGVEVERWCWDTMLAAHMADPQMGVAGLKFQAFTELGQPFYAKSVERLFQTETTEGLNSIHKADPNDLLQYNGIDALAELDLGILQMYCAGKQTKIWSTTLPNQRYFTPGVLNC